MVELRSGEVSISMKIRTVDVLNSRPPKVIPLLSVSTGFWCKFNGINSTHPPPILFSSLLPFFPSGKGAKNYPYCYFKRNK